MLYVHDSTAVRARSLAAEFDHVTTAVLYFELSLGVGDQLGYFSCLLRLSECLHDVGKSSEQDLSL